jgi:hypothetical protein
MVWFSEVSPRPHDTGMVTMITQWQNEFELHARAILGLPVDTSLKSPGASAVIYGGVDAQGIVFDGVAEALQVPNSDIRLFGKPESFTKRRMGVALVHDADVEVARGQAGGQQGQAAGGLSVCTGSKKAALGRLFSSAVEGPLTAPRRAAGLVGAFPGELGLFAAEVAVGGGLGVDRAQQVQHLDDALGRRSKCSCTRAAIFSSEITPVPSV